MSDQVMTGVVKFMSYKGYGFIMGDDGIEYKRGDH